MGEKTHAKRCFNQLQKHWMCVVQITGNKKNRADAITRIKEGALLLVSTHSLTVPHDHPVGKKGA